MSTPQTNARAAPLRPGTPEKRAVAVHHVVTGPEGAPVVVLSNSLADDVVALLDTLGVARAHVVGLSLGGMTGMRLAARNPDRVDRLVVPKAAHLANAEQPHIVTPAIIEHLLGGPA